MKKWKIISILICAIIFCFCIGIDGWYIYVWKFGPQKAISNTYEIGLQTANGESRYFAELNYFSNEENNGLELLEIKFNYMLDENQEMFYSQGLQYVSDTTNDNINFAYKRDASQTKGKYIDGTSGWYNGGDNYGYWGTYTIDNGASVYNYASSDNYVTPYISSNPLSLDTRFKIQVGNNLFLMKFKNEDTEMTPTTFEYSETGKYHFYLVYGRQDYNWYYSYYDYSYFAKLMYQVAKSITPGTNKAIVFEFGNLFDYYLYDSNSGQYSDTKYENCDSVIQDMRSYYSIKVNVSANGAQKASDSIFNAIHGSTTFNLLGDYASDNYFIGRTIINCGIYDFDYIPVLDNKCVIKLKNEFVDFYKNKHIYLSIILDLDQLSMLGIEFIGLAEDNNLNEFNIYRFNTRQIIDGNVVLSEVEYA